MNPTGLDLLRKLHFSIYLCWRVFVRRYQNKNLTVISAITDVSGLLGLEENIPKDKVPGLEQTTLGGCFFSDNAAAAAAPSVVTGEHWVEVLVPVPACHHSS